MISHEYYRAYEERYRLVYALGARTWRQTEVDGELVAFIRKWAPLPGDAIDLGCGEGIDAIWLAKRGWRVVGVDISPTAIRRAQELAAEAGATIDFRISDVLQLADLADQSFDLAVNISTLHLLVDAGQRLQHLLEAHRILRPGGSLFLDNLGRGRAKESRGLPAGHPIEYDLHVRDGTVRVTLPAVPSCPLTDRQTRAELGGAGFLIRRLYRVGHGDRRRIICWAQRPNDLLR